jgi:hypothetical protein
MSNPEPKKWESKCDTCSPYLEEVLGQRGHVQVFWVVEEKMAYAECGTCGMLVDEDEVTALWGEEWAKAMTLVQESRS